LHLCLRVHIQSLWPPLPRFLTIFNRIFSFFFQSRVGFFHRYPRQFFFNEPQSISPHVMTKGNKTCLRLGTRFFESDDCICREGWFNEFCDIPDSLFHTHSMTFAEKRHLQLRRKTTRRIIYGAPFNHEFSMLEALLNELYDIVDVFIFVESSYTAFGRRKPLRLLPRLYRGYLKKFHLKIMYLYFDHFPTGARKDGWIADSYWRSYVAKHGLGNIHGIQDHDLFLVLDLDELPLRDTLAFLKFHDGYPEPFGVRLRWTVFGYFWQNLPYTQVVIGCTVGFLKNVYHNNSNTLRSGNIDPNAFPELNNYKRSHRVRLWFFGDVDRFAGWHCSSCLDPEGIRTKFMSAQNGDFPRWGNFKEKMELSYIKSLIKDGKWFDGSTSRWVKGNMAATLYAPKYILRNWKKYKDILFNPYEAKV